MKKTIIILLAASGIAAAATQGVVNTTDANLKAYWNFDASANPVVGSGWNELPTWNSEGKYGDSQTPSTHPYTENAGLKAADGFTVSFDINNASSGMLLSMTCTGNMNAPWRNISITMSDEYVVSAQFHGTMNQAVTTTLTETQVKNEWTTLTLVGSVDSANASTLILTFYVNGDYAGTSTTPKVTLMTGSNTINNMQFGCFADSSQGAPTNFDNILVYSKALTAEEVGALVKGVSQSVPEPTTSTLSLLALVGLASRRRRK